MAAVKGNIIILNRLIKETQALLLSLYSATQFIKYEKIQEPLYHGIVNCFSLIIILSSYGHGNSINQAGSKATTVDTQCISILAFKIEIFSVNNIINVVSCALKSKGKYGFNPTLAPKSSQKGTDPETSLGLGNTFYVWSWISDHKVFSDEKRAAFQLS